MIQSTFLNIIVAPRQDDHITTLKTLATIPKVKLTLISLLFVIINKKASGTFLPHPRIGRFGEIFSVDAVLNALPPRDTGWRFFSPVSPFCKRRISYYSFFLKRITLLVWLLTQSISPCAHFWEKNDFLFFVIKWTITNHKNKPLFWNFLVMIIRWHSAMRFSKTTHNTFRHTWSCSH